jgi:ribosomal protein L37E
MPSCRDQSRGRLVERFGGFSKPRSLCALCGFPRSPRSLRALGALGGFPRSLRALCALCGFPRSLCASAPLRLCASAPLLSPRKTTLVNSVN